MIHWPSIALWGFAATAVLTSLLRASQSMGLSRMDIPFMLGTIFTEDRELPASVITRIDDGIIYLRVAKHELNL